MKILNAERDSSERSDVTQRDKLRSAITVFLREAYYLHEIGSLGRSFECSEKHIELSCSLAVKNLSVLENGFTLG